METTPKYDGNFDNFAKQLAGEEVVLEVGNEPEPQEIADESLHCEHCEWKTHKSSKDKKRGMRNHIRIKHPTIFAEMYPKPGAKVEILPGNLSSVADDIETMGESDEVVRDKLMGDLELLKIKFHHIPFNFNYNNNSSINHLKRQKTLFMRVLNDEAGTEAVFNLLVIGSKAIEKVADVSNVVDINGYASDVKQNREEIYPILKNMVDTGVLDVGHLSPELRLGMVMASIAINRIEQNKVHGGGFLGEMEHYEEE